MYPTTMYRVALSYTTTDDAPEVLLMNERDFCRWATEEIYRGDAPEDYQGIKPFTSADEVLAAAFERSPTEFSLDISPPGCEGSVAFIEVILPPTFSRRSLDFLARVRQALWHAAVPLWECDDTDTPVSAEEYSATQIRVASEHVATRSLDGETDGYGTTVVLPEYYGKMHRAGFPPPVRLRHKTNLLDISVTTDGNVTFSWKGLESSPLENPATLLSALEGADRHRQQAYGRVLRVYADELAKDNNGQLPGHASWLHDAVEIELWDSFDTAINGLLGVAAELDPPSR